VEENPHISIRQVFREYDIPRYLITAGWCTPTLCNTS